MKTALEKTLEKDIEYIFKSVSRKDFSLVDKKFIFGLFFRDWMNKIEDCLKRDDISISSKHKELWQQLQDFREL